MNPVFTRLPSNTLIKGVSMAFRPGDTTSFTGFGGVFGGGGQTYDYSWFTRSMDVIVATAGNTAHFYGEIEQQMQSALNPTDYLNRVDQVINYAASVGLYVYWTAWIGYELIGVADGSGVITATARQRMRDVYNRVRAHSNVIAFDAITEPYAWVENPVGLPVDDGHIHQPNITGPQLATLINTIYNDLKSESTDLPITFSGFQHTFDANLWQPFAPRALNDANFDYFDFHCEYNLTMADIVPALSELKGRPMIIGEFGQTTETIPGLRCDYPFMLRVAQQANIVGCMAWSAFDHSTVPTQSWGMADNDGTLRANRGVIFEGFPTVPIEAAGNWTFNGSISNAAA